MRTAIYPGTFDPITLGHADVIQKSLKLCDRLIVATTNTKNKNYFFPIDERIKIIKKSVIYRLLIFFIFLFCLQRFFQIFSNSGAMLFEIFVKPIYCP